MTEPEQQPVREITAFEYLCAYCREPFLEPEFDTPFYVRADEEGNAPALSDFGEQGEMYQVVEGYSRQETVHSVVNVITPLEMHVHAWHKDAKACWHWCCDGEVMRIGPPDACPVKETHES